MEVILNQENLKQALKRVKANKGAPGVDGISVSELPDHLKRQWPELRSNLLAGRYKPQPVRKVEIPKPGGGTRQLGIPTVMDRFIQQAVMQVLQSQWDPTFSESSYGFRVGRSAHQAVKRAKRYVEEGQHWVVDIDLEKFFDRVNHDVLMSRVAKRITDKRVLKLMRAFLNAGIMQAGLVSPQMEGTPQGGLLSPLLSNVLLDELDRELEKRGLKHVRYADDSNIYVRSKRAGKRVKESISPGKGRAWIFIAPESIRRAKSRRREITGRSKGRSLEQVIGKLRVYLTGWRNYYSLNELPSLTRNLLGWIRRRLRSLLWKQWKKGRARYSELRVRGVGKDLAAQTVGSSHKQWRISLSPALCIALPNRLFREMGLPDI
ncbi:group II intron reverse transcriptase/maturase [Serratia symbiotica]|uniref:group II intron reverse transcriptase/maturase n=1 Tax=Serratia symbiotica TaxID=138074 RepID=UPI002091B9A3|nr:group II intron reverse transcriptase/maturase [Serratia symbiotica]USS95818.1 group II intron reverse transcriptase/maturase [Serratia symbiotica]